MGDRPSAAGVAPRRGPSRRPHQLPLDLQRTGGQGRSDASGLPHGVSLADHQAADASSSGRPHLSQFPRPPLDHRRGQLRLSASPDPVGQATNGGARPITASPAHNPAVTVLQFRMSPQLVLTVSETGRKHPVRSSVGGETIPLDALVNGQSLDSFNTPAFGDKGATARRDGRGVQTVNDQLQRVLAWSLSRRSLDRTQLQRRRRQRRALVEPPLEQADSQRIRELDLATNNSFVSTHNRKPRSLSSSLATSWTTTHGFPAEVGAEYR